MTLERPSHRDGENALQPYVSGLGAWALSVGTAIGWGSLVVTNSEYLANAGPIGSALGMALGALLMFIMARNFYYMVCASPDAGGIYTYTKTVFGYDRAFLISWFVSLTYMAVLWANATSLPLFARYFLGDTFCFVRLYSLFGYDIYLGEILLTLAVFLLFGFICMKSKTLAMRLMTGTVAVFCVGITVCFSMVFFSATVGAKGVSALEPAFLPDAGILRQVLKIAFITPWAFVGLESVSHSAAEFSFPVKRLLRILHIAIITTTLLYMFILLMSVTAYPPGYGSWLEYIRDLDNLSGIEGLPAFYAAYTYLGNAGVVILMLSLLGLIFSSLIGNIISLSRLFYALAKDRILPSKYAVPGRKGNPDKAVLLVILLSLPIPLVGRTAISWIVGVTNIGATLLYGFVSGAALRAAKREKNRRLMITGAAGLGLMILFGCYLLLQDVFGDSGMTHEGHFIIILWSILGLLYFRVIMVHDHGRRFGKNLTVWIVLVAFIFVLTMIWVCEWCIATSDSSLLAIRNHYAAGPDVKKITEDATLLPYQRNLIRMVIIAAAAVVGSFVISLGAMLSNWLYVRKCEDETARELGTVKTIAYRDSLTGVKSKHAFVEIESEYDRAIDLKKAENFAVLVCDVNGLKHINDTLGHKAGDQYIKDASALICDFFKHSPVYRIGGDEFVVLLNGHDYPERHSLTAAFDQTIEQNLTCGKVVISIGLSDYDPKKDNSFHAVFERADQLMYQRKQHLKRMGAVTRD